jgi:hypothetical protein
MGWVGGSGFRTPLVHGSISDSSDYRWAQRVTPAELTVKYSAYVLVEQKYYGLLVGKSFQCRM